MLLAGGGLPPAARAAVLSPGALARGHEHLEGLANCTKCHRGGEGLAEENCLECHRELKERVAQGRGFHGRIPAAERACERCHHDHQGREFRMLDWGPAGRDRFDHARTGNPLKGKHLKTPCEKCHDPRLVVDPVVRTRMAEYPSRPTYLGAPQKCVGCHFEEHRGQLATDCERCHDDQAFKPARRFDHARARFPLRGKHAKVDCVKCHPKREDETTAPGTFPAPKSKFFLTMKPLPFDDCTDCHKKDPHAGRFGAVCDDCHTNQGWKVLSPKGKSHKFHAKGRYQLEGAHLKVSCKSCHGPWGPGKARYKDLRFKACTDCHADSHVGQLARPGRPSPTCDTCHTVQGWKPVRYEIEDHARTQYPLAGGHRPVSCALCHRADPRMAERVDARVRATLRRQGRPVQVSEAVMVPPDSQRCESCHRDPHGGQFRKRPKPADCVACHQVASWSELLFDHTRDSRFPLAGKHAKAQCAACHPEKDEVVLYRPIDVVCASCHADPHAGQFLGPGGAASDCARCHEFASWKDKLRFVHEPPFTKYRLKGKHAQAKCDVCHPAIPVAPGVTAKRYKPLPVECEECHADFHKGAFRGYVP